LKTIIIIILAVVIGLAVIGGGFGSFVGDVEKGAERVEESGVIQAVIEKGSALISEIFKNPDVTLENPPSGVSTEQMQIALRIKELTDKSKEITAAEYKELETLIQTYERNWGN